MIASRLLLALLLFLGVPSAAQATATLDAVQLRSLEDGTAHGFAAYKGRPVLLMVFEPECNWCLKQVAALNELAVRCGDRLPALGVGVRGDRQSLKAEIRRTGPEFPTYQANAGLLELLGEVPATPITYVLDESLAPLMKLRGYIPFEQLLETAEVIIGESCS